MRFRFRAYKDFRTVNRGWVDAADAKGAAALLKDRGLVPVAISEDRSLIGAFTRDISRPSADDLVNFTRQLATMITAGLPITDSLSLLKAQSSRAFAPIVGGILVDIQAGVSLSSAMAKFPQVFSRVYVALVKAGEAAGVMENILKRLADTLERRREFMAKVKGAMIYPAIVISGMIAVMIIMVVVVIPKLTQVYAEFNAELPLATRIIQGVSTAFIRFWWLIFPALGAALIGLRLYIQKSTGRRQWDKFIYQVPLVGPLVEQVMLTEMTRTLSLLVGSGVSIVDALNIVAAAAGNVIVEAELKQIAKKVEKGLPVSASFAESATFPPMLAQMMAVGEETGKMDDVLSKLSTYYESLSEQRVKALTTAIEPIIIVILGLGVGFLVFAVVIPIYTITNQL